MTHVDSERQDRGVKLMLALLGAAVLAFGWLRWATLVGLLR
jgi:hypothetical protein